MAYGRETLRKAGKAVMDFDEAYAKKVGAFNKQTATGNQAFDDYRTVTSAVPLRDAYNAGTSDMSNLSAGEKARNYGAVGNAMVGNVMSRYALPAGGVTLAGAALYDLTTSFGGAADQPEQGQLGMG